MEHLSKIKKILCLVFAVCTFLGAMASASAELQRISTGATSLNIGQKSELKDVKTVATANVHIPNMAEKIVPKDTSALPVQVVTHQKNVQSVVPKAEDGEKLTDPLEKLNKSVPVIMYHSISDDPTKWSEYCIPATLLESDFIAYKNVGFTPIDMQTYIEMHDAYAAAKVATGADRSAKISVLETLLAQNPNPILLTFDDGYLDWYTILYPLAQKHNVKVNLSLVGRYTEGSGGFLSTENVMEMAKSDLFTFGNHTHLLHEEPFEALKALYDADENHYKIAMDYLTCEGILEVITGRPSAFMSYPYGIHSKLSESILNDMGVRVSLATNVKSRIPHLSDDLRIVPRINRSPWQSSDEFVAGLKEKIMVQNRFAYPPDESFAPTVQPNNTRLIQIQKGENTYVFQGKIRGNTTVLPMQNISGYEDVFVTYDVVSRMYVVHLFGKDIYVNYKTGELICDGKHTSFGRYMSAQLPVRALFEVAGYHVTYNAAENSIQVIQFEPETLVVEPEV